MERGNPKRKDDYMETIQVTKNAYTIDDAMDALFSKLVEAISYISVLLCR